MRGDNITVYGGTCLHVIQELVHGKRGKIIGRRELWGANRRPVNQPPIIIDTGSTSLPFLYTETRPPFAVIHPVRSRKPALRDRPPSPQSSTTPAFPTPSDLPAARHPTTWRDKRTADTIIYFANVLQNCRYSFSVQSIQFSAPRVRPDGSVRAALCSRAMVLSFRDGTIMHTQNRRR